MANQFNDSEIWFCINGDLNCLKNSRKYEKILFIFQNKGNTKMLLLGMKNGEVQSAQYNPIVKGSNSESQKETALKELKKNGFNICENIHVQNWADSAKSNTLFGSNLIAAVIVRSFIFVLKIKREEEVKNVLSELKNNKIEFIEDKICKKNSLEIISTQKKTLPNHKNLKKKKL